MLCSIINILFYMLRNIFAVLVSSLQAKGGESRRLSSVFVAVDTVNHSQFTISETTRL